MEISESAFACDDDFIALIPDLLVYFRIVQEERVELCALRSYCLRQADRPKGLFFKLAKDPHLRWNSLTAEDMRAAEYMLNPNAPTPPAELDREGLITEIRRYVGQFLPGGHEVINMGILHQRDGLVSWERHSDDALAAIVGDLRAGRRGDPPELLTPQQAARALGGESLSALLEDTSLRLPFDVINANQERCDELHADWDGDGDC